MGSTTLASIFSNALHILKSGKGTFLGDLFLKLYCCMDIFPIVPNYMNFQELEDQSIKKLPKGLGKAREDLTGAKFENMESQPAVK